MKRQIIKLVQTLFFLCLAVICYGQDDAYSLLTERFVDRPLAMHRGQLQVNSGYEFSILNKKFDDEGTSLDLTDEGDVSVKHRIPLDIRYGLLEQIQLRTALNYARMGLRTQSMNLVTYSGTIYLSEVESWKGFDDLFFGLDLTVPFLPHFLNWTLSGGISLPVFAHEPEQPDHIVEYLEPYPGSIDIRYQYNNTFGSGVMSAKFGITLKLRFPKIACTGSFMMNTGLEDGESIYWQSRLKDGNIEYREIPFQYNPGQTINYDAAVAYQAIDWLAVFVLFQGMNSTGGWTTETGIKKGLEEVSLLAGGFGYDIQVSPNLRINQHIMLPMAGRNILATWVFETGLSVNFMTVK